MGPTALFVIGLLFVGCVAILLLRVAQLPRLHAEGRLRQIEVYGFGEEPGLEQNALAPRRGALAAIAQGIGRFAIANFGTLKPLERRELLAAGIYEHSVDEIHGMRLMAAFGLPGAILALTLLSGPVASQTALELCALAALGWLLPASAIKRRGQRRLDRVDAALPELIDVLTATVEAGLSFASSLALCADRFEGPLGQELRLTLREQTMGLSTNAALEHMRERCDTPSVRAFARAVSQGESLGVSIGAMLRNLASETRKRRRTAAQERIQKAPVKLLFPLILLIFPALFVVLLYPAFSHILSVLGGG